MEPVEGYAGYVLVRVRVQPRASRNALIGQDDRGLRIALTAPPVDGAANKALEAFLAEQLRVSKSAVRVSAGLKSREKTVRVEGLGAAEVSERLGLAG